MLRTTCYKAGLVLRQRTYDFSIAAPFTADDVRDVQPVVHHHQPPTTHVDGLISRGLACISTNEGAQMLHDALAHCHQVMGAIAPEPAVCYGALALHDLLEQDVDSAILHQRKALVIIRRTRGADSVAVIPGMACIGVAAMAAGRGRDAAAWLRRALYIARFSCGFVPPHIAACLAALYQENGMDAEALPLLRLAERSFDAAVAALRKEPLSQYHNGALSDSLACAAICRSQLALSIGRHEGDFTGAARLQKDAVRDFASSVGERHALHAEAEDILSAWIQAAIDAKSKAGKAGGKKAAGKKGRTGPAAVAASVALSRRRLFLCPRSITFFYLLPLFHDTVGIEVRRGSFEKSQDKLMSAIRARAESKTGGEAKAEGKM